MNPHNRLIANLTRRGKKSLAQRLLRQTLLGLKNHDRRRGRLLSFLASSLSRAQPLVGFRNRKVAGVVHKVPRPYPDLSDMALASKWLVAGSGHQPGPSAPARLARELIESQEGRGVVLKRRRELHRLALANKTNLKYM